MEPIPSVVERRIWSVGVSQGLVMKPACRTPVGIRGAHHSKNPKSRAPSLFSHMAMSEPRTRVTYPLKSAKAELLHLLAPACICLHTKLLLYTECITQDNGRKSLTNTLSTPRAPQRVNPDWLWVRSGGMRMHHDAMYIRCVASWRGQWGGRSGDATVGSHRADGECHLGADVQAPTGTPRRLRQTPPVTLLMPSNAL